MNIDLLNYFLYLRDVSRKIAVSSNWAQCLKVKAEKGNKSLFQISAEECEREFSRGSYLKTLNKVENYLKKFSEKEAFLGLVSIYGKGDNNNLLGSIFNIPIQYVVGEDTLGVEDVIFDIDNIFINYPLLLSFFKSNQDNLFFEFNKVEAEIEKYFNNEEFNNELYQLRNINSLIDILRKYTTDFFQTNEIYLLEDPSSYDRKVVQQKEAPRIDFNNVFLFAFDVPDEISTFKALDRFCKEIQSSEKIESDLLNNMLSGVETDRCNESFNPKIFDYIPLSLSTKQKQSVENAFCEKVSYVQGPPGTGKSHTITGIALAALLLKKKVLIISQKDAALKVVKAKLDEHFKSCNLNQDSVPYIYFDKSVKRKLKGSFEKFLEAHKTNKEGFIDSIRTNATSLLSDMDSILKATNELQKKIDIELNKQCDFSEKNKSFINDSVRDGKQLGFLNKLDITPLVSENEKFIGLIEDIEAQYEKEFKLSVYSRRKLFQLNSEFNKKFSANISFIQLLKDKILKTYVERVIALSQRLEEVNTLQKKLATPRQMSLYYDDMRGNERKSEDLIGEYFNAEVEYNLLSTFFEYAKQRKTLNEFDNFAKMLHFQKADVIVEKFKSINFNNLLNVFNLWLCEIRHIGEILPNQKEMFDLIIIDEASQVNTAEIFPILYRGKSLCVVGDDKQLGLESVGLNFMISTKEEQQIWENHLGTYISYDRAKERDLVVTKSSFLNLITSNFSSRTYCKIMLDEHYRSLPQLAHFTNNFFYNGELKVMTETPEKALTQCFQSFKVQGQRLDKKNDVEAVKVLEIIMHLMDLKHSEEVEKSIFKKDYSIGVISLNRDQVDYIKEKIFFDKILNAEEVNDSFIINGCRVKCGTPEELQGDEFDSVIISATVDENSRNSGHYSNEKRLNVATSRARFFTYFIYTDVAKIEFFVKYLNYFGVKEVGSITSSELIGWSYCEHKLESNFERYVADFLKDIILESDRENFKLFNQVEFAKKRLDFVIYNQVNQKFVAVEVDGQFHFRDNKGRVYSEEHYERIDLLKRAGWKILNTPYFCWYNNGRIEESNINLINEKIRLKKEVVKLLS